MTRYKNMKKTFFRIKTKKNDKKLIRGGGDLFSSNTLINEVIIYVMN